MCGRSEEWVGIWDGSDHIVRMNVIVKGGDVDIYTHFGVMVAMISR